MSGNFNNQCRSKVGQLWKNENFYKAVLQGQWNSLEKAIPLVKELLLFLICFQITSLNGSGFWWPERSHTANHRDEHLYQPFLYTSREAVGSNKKLKEVFHEDSG